MKQTRKSFWIESFKAHSNISELTRKRDKTAHQSKAALFESYADNLLTEDEYVYSKGRYSKQIDEAKEKLERLQEESVMQSETLTPQNRWLQAFRQFSDHAELSHDMVQTLISSVVVVAPNEYDFVWNFKGDYEALADYTRLGVAQ